MNKIFTKTCYATLLSIFLTLLAIISIKPFGNDELFFMHYSWALNNEHMKDLLSYPLPFSTIFFSSIYKLGSLNVFIFWKPILSAFYLYLFCKDIKDKKSFASLIILLLIILNRGIEVRPEAICSILLLLLTSFEFDFEKKTIYLKFICLLLMAFISARFSFISILIYIQIALYSKNKIKIQYFVIPILVFLIFYSSLIELPWTTLNELLKWKDHRNVDTAYKLHRIFSPNFSYIFIILMICTHIANKLYNRNAKKSDLFFLCASILNILYLLFFDRVPFEYTFLPTAIYIRWYLNQNYTISFKPINDRFFAKFSLFTLLILFFYDLHMNRNIFQNVIKGYSESKNIQINEKALLNAKVFSYKQLLIRNFICKKYEGYSTYTNRYSFHPICLSDNLTLKKHQKLLSEEQIISQIYSHQKVNYYYDNQNFLYLYK